MLLELISEELLLPKEFINGVAASASHRYQRYIVVGRTGRKKIVHHPSRQLKAIQRWLLRRIIHNLPVHDAAMAYEKGRGICKNSELHRESRFLLRMDFKEFFPSLTIGDVRMTLERAKNASRLDPSWGDADTSLFTNLVCRNQRLTIGAPTSPNLANAICFELDEKLALLTAQFGITYTRYADDLFFSTQRPNLLKNVEAQVQKIVQGIKHPENIQLNHQKTRHSSTRGRRVITGVVLTPDRRLSLGRDIKRRLRSQVHKFERLTDSERSSLRGWLAYSRSIEPDFINRMILKFGLAPVKRAMKY